MSELSAAEVAALVPSWVIHLRAERKTEGTIGTYLKGINAYLAWCEVEDRLPLVRANLEAWTVSLLDAGRTATTARTRMMPVRYLAKWMLLEGEIDDDPFGVIRAPKTDEAVIPVLSDEQVRAFLKACQPPPGESKGLPSLRHRRDEAMIRLLFDTGMRIGECLALEVGDVDYRNDNVVTIRRGKGGRGRRAPFGAQTARALDRYVRVRAAHRLAGEPKLWLGDRGRSLAYGGAYFALNQRAEAAGIANFHPHMLRHASSDRWLAAGGSETGLMARNGWSSPAMVQRYGRANRENRAIEEARRLNLGEL
ncbi:tyrosine-type recombinase/integrase [Nocardioides sp. J54]|uniref:tyrosine-type recombinase/integrase n=1 Tax=Nocardioides sp. J54 TaxID=935866 RepID=UPI0004BCF3CD|nr:tyrosine-type recombinase/integrase [Nocardioides sp. J54]